MRGSATSFSGLLGFLLLVSCIASPVQLPLIHWDGRTTGSPYKVQKAGADLSPMRVDELKAEVEQRLKEANRQMSHYDPDGELSRFNRAPANTPFNISPEFARVVRFSLEMNRCSRGAFDPTLAPVINLWGFGEQFDQHAVPPEFELKAGLKKRVASTCRLRRRTNW